MWKMLVAFVIFAVAALAAVFSMGDKASLQGEAGGHGDSHAEAPAVASLAQAPAAADATAAPAAPATPAAPEADKK